MLTFKPTEQPKDYSSKAWEDKMAKRTTRLNTLKTQLEKVAGYDELVVILDKLVQDDVELASHFGDNIRNFSESQLRGMIRNIIDNLNQSMVNRVKEAKFVKYDTNKADVLWNKYYSEHYNQKNQSLQVLADSLGLEQSQKKNFLDQINKALVYFNIQNSIFFSGKNRCFESLFMRNKTGTGGQKITTKKLWHHIRLFSEIGKRGGNIIGSANFKKATSIISGTPQFQFLRNIINKLKAEKQDKLAQKKIKNFKMNRDLSLSTVQRKLSGKLNKYFQNPGYQTEVNKYDQARYLSEYKINTAVPIIYQNSEPILKNKADDVIIDLQQNLKYVPQGLQDQFNTTIQAKNSGNTIRDLRNVHPALRLKKKIKMF